MRALILAFAVVAAAACTTACTTSADNPPQNGEGPFVTLNGGSFDKLVLNPLDGAGVIDTIEGKTRFRAYVEDRASICSTSGRRQNSVVLAIDVRTTKPKLEADTYPDPGVTISKLDATCAANPSYTSGSGSVTITSVSSTVVTGSFDVTLQNDGGTLKGSFNIPLCPGFRLDACDP